MPRLVDSQERRADVAGAVWRVVAREGLDAASVRTVAAEAGLSTGSLRHWFATQSDLHAFAMGLVVERIRARVGGLDLPQDPVGAATLVLEQFLPLDAERALESEVWLAFTARSPVEQRLRVVREAAYDELFDVCRHQVLRLVDTAAAPAAVDAEAHRLYALVDGLLLHGVVRPQRATHEVLRSVLRSHLEQLLAEVVPVPREAVRGLLGRAHDALVDSGLLEDEPVELIEGDLVRVMPQKPPHTERLRRVTRALRGQVPDGWVLSMRSPLAAGDRSAPEPDLAVVPDENYLYRHPAFASLVVEVSRSSSSSTIDLGAKARVYAAIGVPDYWVIDVIGGRLHAHRGASRTGYEQVTVHESGVVATSGEPALTLDVDAVLGRG